MKLAYGIAEVAQTASSPCCWFKDDAGEGDREGDGESPATWKS